jgi:murein DD-endopeptidase MepM/ murein hydrolase activator NlpD
LVKTVTSAIAAATIAAVFGMSGPVGAAEPTATVADPTSTVADPTATVAALNGGGLVVPGVPKIKDIVCISGCSGIRKSSEGGTVQISGSRLNSVALVNFAGKTKRVKAEPSSSTSTSLLAEVPNGAATGRVRVISSTGSVSSPSSVILEIGDPPETQNSPLRISDASTTPSIAYKYGARRPRLDFVVTGGKPKNDLRIDVVTPSGSVIASRTRLGVERGSSQKVKWNSKSGGKPAPNGRYRFVVRSIDGTAALLSKSVRKAQTRASRSKAADPLGFRLYGYVFPFRGKHYFGDSIGAGRGHQGLDIMTDCGTRLIAARGGTVYYNAYQAGGAGNYLVINLAGTRNESHVYMHLAKPSKLKVGTRVKTGQKIGVVGSTGRSSACHLHFEHWSSPGWYQGGTFLDPAGAVKRWDRYS